MIPELKIWNLLCSPFNTTALKGTGCAATPNSQRAFKDIRDFGAGGSVAPSFLPSDPDSASRPGKSSWSLWLDTNTLDLAGRKLT